MDGSRDCAIVRYVAYMLRYVVHMYMYIYISLQVCYVLGDRQFIALYLASAGISSILGMGVT